jgi:hypothetical protein
MQQRKNGKFFFISMLMVIIVLFLSACSNNHNNNQVIKDELKKIAKKINSDFAVYIPMIDSLADYTENLYSKESRKRILASVDKKSYNMSNNGIFYKPDFSTSAVFVSGYIPIDEKLKNIVYFTEPIETELKSICEKNPNIVQAYYNDKYSYNRIYPGFDVLSQYQPKMNIPEFNFYYLADKKHNPSQKSVWVNEPYVDPAGRGWMISLIKPVYYDNVLEGVVGLDITIKEIVNIFLAGLSRDYMIISSTGMIIATSEKLSNLFSLPPLRNHKYIETVNTDTFLPERYNLLKSKKENIRILSKKINKSRNKEFELNLNGKNFIVFTDSIPLLNWTIITVE